MDSFNDFTPEQIAAWKRGELVIEFQFDELLQVNQRDFEKWVQERQIKPNTINYSTHNCSFDIECPTWKVKALGVDELPTLEEINEPRCVK